MLWNPVSLLPIDAHVKGEQQAPLLPASYDVLHFFSLSKVNPECKPLQVISLLPTGSRTDLIENKTKTAPTHNRGNSGSGCSSWTMIIFAVLLYCLTQMCVCPWGCVWLTDAGSGVKLACLHLQAAMSVSRHRCVSGCQRNLWDWYDLKWELGNRIIIRMCFF